MVSPTTAAIVNDPFADLSDWDDAELLHGRRYDKNKKWTGKPNKLVPTACLRELNKRRFARATDTLAESLTAGAEAIRDIIEDTSVDPAIRLKAVELLYDRVWGKPKVSVDLMAGMATETPWQALVAAAIVPTARDALALMAGDPNNIVDGEIVEGEVIDIRPSKPKPSPSTVSPRRKAARRRKVST